MRNIINTKTRLLAVGAMALSAAVIAIGCNGSSGSGGLNQVGSSIGSGLGSLGRGTGQAFNNIGSGIPSFGNAGSSGTNDPMALLGLGKKFFEAVDVMNPQRQLALGQSCAIVVGNSYSIADNQNRNDYVNMVGLTVASVSEKPELEYCFAILDTPDINAYSTPGGYIFITRGALDLCADESELAGVLAHEVAHVVNDDGMEQIKTEKWTEVVTTGASLRSPEFRQFEQITDKMADKVITGIHSNEQEYKADAAAVTYLSAAGYDPNGMARILQKFQDKTGAGDITNIMKSHPGTAERLRRVKQKITNFPPGGAALHDRFAKWTK